jgi:hypothetical protein
MATVSAVQRNATRNQSTVDITRKNVFTYGNRYREAIFKNNSGGSLTIDSGSLVLRDTTTVANVLPAIAGATLADVIGVLFVDGPITLANNATTSVNYCISGDIDAGLLSLPATVTLDTVVGNKLLRDVLTDLGLVCNNVSEIAKTDN